LPAALERRYGQRRVVQPLNLIFVEVEF